MKNDRYVNGHKISLWSSVSTLSISLLILLFLFMISGVGLYIWMAAPPARLAAIEDRAGLFTDVEFDELTALAEQVSQEKQINVFVVTRAVESEKGKNSSYGDDEAMEKSHNYAKSEYTKRAKLSAFKDNSGFLFLIDMETRTLYLFTQDRVHARFSDRESKRITNSASSYAKNEEYKDAVQSVLDTLRKSNLSSVRYSFIQFLFVAGPFLTTLLVWLVLRKKGRGKSAVSSATYMKDFKRLPSEADTFTHKTVSVQRVSSSSGSSGSGRSGGGSSGGGGGGGRSGGGGSRF